MIIMAELRRKKTLFYVIFFGLFIISVLWVYNSVPEISYRSAAKFTVDYKNGIFLKDGKPFYYVSGSLHYFRVPHMLWYDRLLKLRASGINVVSTYVAWNIHEPHVGQFNFDGDADLIKFIKIAKSVGLYVNIRPGPYICSEWELGGLPYFVLGTPQEKITIRSYDKRYIQHVDRYFSVLLPKLKPYLYENGGPIILVQVENEFGSYITCDHDYMQHLTNLMRLYLGRNTLLYTADGWDMHHLICGPVHNENVLTTLNFGPNTDHTSAFSRLRYFQKYGPLVNSEYYPGWLDHWNENHQRKSTSLVANEFINMLNSKLGQVYVNFYMFFGGTNFGFYSGANMNSDDRYQPDPTSYDYDAPMSECADITDKFLAIRNIIKEYRPRLVDNNLLDKIRNSTKKSYGKVRFTQYLDFQDIKSLATKTLQSQKLLTFEELQQDYGFVLYEILFTKSGDFQLRITEPRDRVYVFADGKYIGNIYRSLVTAQSLKLPPFKRLSLLVENMGRVNYGRFLSDFKGILGSVTVGDINLSIKKEWNIWCLPLNNTADARFTEIQTQIGPGSLLRGNFTVEEPAADTWLNMDKFTKGVLFINDKNLGRYWPAVGPQKHLYVPSVWLKPGTNYVTIFEVEKVPDVREQELTVDLVDYPDVG